MITALYTSKHKQWSSDADDGVKALDITQNVVFGFSSIVNEVSIPKCVTLNNCNGHISLRMRFVFCKGIVCGVNVNELSKIKGVDSLYIMSLSNKDVKYEIEVDDEMLNWDCKSVLYWESFMFWRVW